MKSCNTTKNICPVRPLLLTVILAMTCSTAWAEEQKPADELPPIPEDNAAVRAILANDPATPTEWIEAAKILADHRRPDLAKDFLKKTLAAKLDSKQLAALENTFGTSAFSKMASNEALAPEAGQLANEVHRAARKERTDPARLEQLIGELQAVSAEDRFRTMEELRRARGDAVGPLIRVLADGSRSSEHPNVRAAIVELSSDALRPLVGTLVAKDPGVRIEAIRALAALKAQQAVPYLLAHYCAPGSPADVRAAAKTALQRLVGQLPERHEAAEMAAERARQYFDQLRPVRADIDGKVVVWSWDEKANSPVSQQVTAAAASRILAARLARDAYQIEPNDPRIRTLYLSTMLELAAYQAGLDQPLSTDAGSSAARAVAMGVDALEGVLVDTLETGHAPAATAAARLLGRDGKSERLLHHGARPTPLVAAVRNPDRRLRLAAIETILALDPQMPFAGSSALPEELGFLAASTGLPCAIMAGPVTEDLQRTAGYLVEKGYRIELANNGRDLVRLAIASPDCQLILADAGLGNPTLDFALQQLRHQHRTARLPVGVIARHGYLQRAEHIARNDSLAKAFIRPHRKDDMLWIVEQTLALPGRERIPNDQRSWQAGRALELLTELRAKSDLFDIQRVEDAVVGARYVPELSSKSVVLLGELGTAKSQRTLVELASNWGEPIGLRKEAVAAFKQSIKKFGLLLTTKELLQQYKRYNQSVSADVETQQVLARVLDAIEAPTALLEVK